MKVGPFKVEKGEGQCCPLSMILFNLSINQVLLAVDPSNIPTLPMPQTAEQWILQNPPEILVYATILVDIIFKKLNKFRFHFVNFINL